VLGMVATADEAAGGAEPGRHTGQCGEEPPFRRPRT
jgi:hypothetical protein